MADFDRSKRRTLVKIGSLQARLEDLLGIRVELRPLKWRGNRRSRAMREAVIAFEGRKQIYVTFCKASVMSMDSLAK